MLWTIIIVGVICGIFGAVMSIRSEIKSCELAEKRFTDAGYTVSEKNYHLIVDEEAKKWICTDYPNMQILDFDDISDVELVEDGITYKSEGGVLRAVTGGALFGSAGAIVGASTAKKSQKANKVYVVIYTKRLKMSNFKINVYNRSEGENLIGMIKAMQYFSTQSDNQISNEHISIADEIAKYKSLLDSGAITQEEYDKKKAELLNL